MTTELKSKSTSPLRGMGLALGLGGLLAVIVGVLIVAWPDQSAKAVTAIIAVYALIAGIVYLLFGFLSKTRGAWHRISNVILGALFIVASIIAFVNLDTATVVLAVLIGVVIGILWIIEGAVALTALGRSVHGESQTWAVVFAVVSVIAGIALILTPVLAVAMLWLFMGIALIVQGAAQIVRAVQMRRTKV